MHITIKRIVALWNNFNYSERISYSISIYVGTDPYEFSVHPFVENNPVLTRSDVTDVKADFVADPFMVYHNNIWYMFFEVLNSSFSQGDIGLATSKDGIDWQYEQIVLDEPFHLSYPYVFEWNESYYMIPESRRANAIRLYKAVEFPTKWTFIRELIVGNYADPSIVFIDGKWWLFALKDKDTLTLHYADNLTGSWTEHPESPLEKGDRNISRPGGRHIVFDGKIIRYIQDGDWTSTKALRVFQVDEITTTSYKDHEIAKSPILVASGSGWNSIGMHHIDPHRISEKEWIACVDGIGKENVFDKGAGGKRIIKKIKAIFN